MIDPAHDLLITHAVRRSNQGAMLRGFELSDARNIALGVGPNRDAVTNAEMVRSLKPGRPRLNAALAALARQTHVPASRRAPAPRPTRLTTMRSMETSVPYMDPAFRKCTRCGYAYAEVQAFKHGVGACPDNGGVAR